VNTEENLNTVAQTCQCCKAMDFFELLPVNNWGWSRGAKSPTKTRISLPRLASEQARHSHLK